MGKLHRVQNNFTSGELDPLLHDRFDIKQYQNGAKQMLNARALPQGGWRRRFGSYFVQEQLKKLTQITTGVTATYPNGGAGVVADDPKDSFRSERGRTGGGYLP